MRLISVFRHETAGTILKALLDRKEISHGDLAHELSITSQGLTWQMNRLKKNHLVVERKENKKLLYSIECTNAPVLAVMAKLIEKP
jgi:predicted ArsR family transcriptional regulator